MKTSDYQNALYALGGYIYFLDQIVENAEKNQCDKKLKTMLKTLRTWSRKAAEQCFTSIPADKRDGTVRQAKQKRVSITTTASPLKEGMHERVLTIDEINELIRVDPLMCAFCERDQKTLKKCSFRRSLLKMDLDGFCTDEITFYSSENGGK